jgi:hypothetical protein
MAWSRARKTEKKTSVLQKLASTVSEMNGVEQSATEWQYRQFKRMNSSKVTLQKVERTEMRVNILTVTS